MKDLRKPTMDDEIDRVLEDVKENKVSVAKAKEEIFYFVNKFLRENK